MVNERRETVPADAPFRVSAWDLAAAGLVICFLALALRGVWGQDATSDERHYFGVGCDIVRTHEWSGFGALHPPLSHYVNSLPLLWLGESSPEDPVALLLCRATSLVVFGVPLLVLVFRWARELYGPPAGLVALALTAFSPTLLAHAPLITPDVPLTATGVLALYLFHRSEHGGRRRAWPWGLALGLCLLTKVSAWLFVAAVVADGILLAWRRRDRLSLLRLGAGLLLAYATLCVGYGFKGLLDTEGKAALLARVPDLPLARLAAHAASPFFPLPYLQAAATQMSVAWHGWPAYLMGELRTTGWWYYFLAALLVKETIPFLLVVAASVIAFPWKRAGRDELLLLLPPILFFACFSLGRVQIGIRYVLPAFPFLAIFASSLTRGRGRRTLPILAVLLAWHAAAAVRACPDFIAYFNELAGGPRNGYRWLADSNLDWGQNRTRMEAYAREHRIPIEPDVLPSAGLVIVRANRLVGIGDPETYRLLREHYDPVGNVGYNWLVYDLGRKRSSP